MEGDYIGPALPPHLLKRLEMDNKSAEDVPTSDAKPEIIGPALPPHLLASSSSSIAAQSLTYPSSDDSNTDDDEMDDAIGPLPGGAIKTVAQFELEKRAIELKLANLGDGQAAGSSDAHAREEWMLELPRVNSIAGMGLTARQFRTSTKDRPDFSDRTSWTDTPLEKEKKSKSGPTAAEVARELDREKRSLFIAQRDSEQEAMVKRHKKKHKRDKTLMEIHEKKLKKKRKVSGRIVGKIL